MVLFRLYSNLIFLKKTGCELLIKIYLFSSFRFLLIWYGFADTLFSGNILVRNVNVRTTSKTVCPP